MYPFLITTVLLLVAGSSVYMSVFGLVSVFKGYVPVIVCMGLGMEKSGLPFRRMYEMRHTFASWALSKGEAPEWVARTLGHVDTSMVYRTYSRYIPNLTRQDGSALEEMFTGFVNKKSDPE